MRGVHSVAVLFERRPRCVERFRRPAQVARDERDLGLGRRHTSRGPTASFGPKARAAFRRRVFARTRSPSCAIAMPRRASAGASSRKATLLSAPRGSPAASARAAAVISESIGIPPHLSLSMHGANICHHHEPPDHIENGRNKDVRRKERKTMTTHKTGTRKEWLAARLELLEAEKQQSPTGCIIDPVAARLAPRAHPTVNPCGGMPPPALHSGATIHARRGGGSCRP